MSDDIDHYLALLDAAKTGDAAAVRRLLAAGVSPDAADVLSGYTALHHAATRGYLDIVRMLVEAGAAVTDRRNTVCSSALAGAVVAGQTEVVAYLLAQGANAGERLYGDNVTLLDEAEQFGFDEIARLLRRAVGRGDG